MAELKFGPAYVPSWPVRRHRTTALALRDAHQVVVDVALARGFLRRQRLDLPEALLEAHEIRRPLRVDVLRERAEPVRQLTLLPPLALLQHRFTCCSSSPRSTFDAFDADARHGCRWREAARSPRAASSRAPPAPGALQPRTCRPLTGLTAAAAAEAGAAACVRPSRL
jgi:hypothetical protein